MHSPEIHHRHLLLPALHLALCRLGDQGFKLRQLLCSLQGSDVPCKVHFLVMIVDSAIRRRIKHQRDLAWALVPKLGFGMS